VSSQQRAIQIADDAEKAHAKVLNTASGYMKKVSKDLQKSGLNVKTEIIEASGNQHPAEIILDYAEKNHVDLIILTTHGRSGISRWAFGSQADKVVTRSKVPVLTITPSGCRAE
jgi:nucleotide-binding universal stress UspA family protein